MAATYAEYLNAATQAAHRAAEVLNRWRRRVAVTEKGHADLVTEADLEAQDAVYSVLDGHFPEHGFLGEESHGSHNRPARDEAGSLWIVDPLDGTTNFVHDVPAYAVSIALEQQGRLVVGVILDPVRRELFQAVAGEGAWHNGEPMRVSPTRELRQALVTTSFPTDLAGQDRMLAVWRCLAARTHGLRRTGSSAINLAYVACGRFDAFHAHCIQAWDVAAGLLLVEEAGGSFTTTLGQTFPWHSQLPLLASNGALHADLVAEFARLAEAEDAGHAG
jgi:myo-inositol-1(or 4)-monophosphatase